MYNARKAVGDFFEEKITEIFNLIRIDPRSLGNVPDLISEDGSFFVEVKASSYSNGGVINREQLFRFDKEIAIKRFYAFAYHSINRDMEKDYLDKTKLRKALDLRSLYLFPFSIVKAYFENTPKRINPKHDVFVQLREKQADEIFNGNINEWNKLDLCFLDYKQAEPHEKIHILTRNGNLEKEILESIRYEKI
jgi:hypothetical protein